MSAYLIDVDRTLIQKNLLLSLGERFLQSMELQRFADELRRAGRSTCTMLSGFGLWSAAAWL